MGTFLVFTFSLLRFGVDIVTFVFFMLDFPFLFLCICLFRRFFRRFRVVCRRLFFRRFYGLCRRFFGKLFFQRLPCRLFIKICEALREVVVNFLYFRAFFMFRAPFFDACITADLHTEPFNVGAVCILGDIADNAACLFFRLGFGNGLLNFGYIELHITVVHAHIGFTDIDFSLVIEFATPMISTHTPFVLSLGSLFRRRLCRRGCIYLRSRFWSLYGLLGRISRRRRCYGCVRGRGVGFCLFLCLLQLVCKLCLLFIRAMSECFHIALEFRVVSVVISEDVT